MARNHDSNEVKILRNTMRQDRQHSDEVSFTRVVAIPDCPDYFDKPRIEMWDKLTTELINAKLLRQVDLMALVILVDNLIKYRTSAEKLVSQPYVQVVRGKAVTNPYIKISKNASETCIKLFAHFGFTPAMRMRFLNLNAPDPNEGDPLAELFNSHQRKQID